MLPPYYFYWFRIDNKHMTEPWLDSAYRSDYCAVWKNQCFPVIAGFCMLIIRLNLHYALCNFVFINRTEQWKCVLLSWYGHFKYYIIFGFLKTYLIYFFFIAPPWTKPTNCVRFFLNFYQKMYEFNIFHLTFSNVWKDLMNLFLSHPVIYIYIATIFRNFYIFIDISNNSVSQYSILWQLMTSEMLSSMQSKKNTFRKCF